MVWWSTCVLLVLGVTAAVAAQADDGIVRRLSDLGGKPYNVSYNSRCVQWSLIAHSNDHCWQCEMPWCPIVRPLLPLDHAGHQHPTAASCRTLDAQPDAHTQVNAGRWQARDLVVWLGTLRPINTRNVSCHAFDEAPSQRVHPRQVVHPVQAMRFCYLQAWAWWWLLRRQP